MMYEKSYNVFILFDYFNRYINQLEMLSLDPTFRVLVMLDITMYIQNENLDYVVLTYYL